MGKRRRQGGTSLGVGEVVEPASAGPLLCADVVFTVLTFLEGDLMPLRLVGREWRCGVSSTVELSLGNLLPLDGDWWQPKTVRAFQVSVICCSDFSAPTQVRLTRVCCSLGTVDRGLEALAVHIPMLEFVAWRVRDRLLNDGVTALAECPQLRSVSLDDCDGVTDSTVKALSRCRLLQAVSLSRCAITDEGVAALAHCAQLRSVGLAECLSVGDEGVVPLISRCVHLTAVDLTATSITDESLRVLAESPTLERVALSNCRGVSDGGARRLTRCTPLRFVSLFRTSNAPISS